MIPKATKCMPACKVQDYDNQISSVSYPQQDLFFHQKLFCDVASHIWHSTCHDENRAYVLNKKQPLLCPILMDFNEFFSQSQIELSMVNIHMLFTSFKQNFVKCCMFFSSRAYRNITQSLETNVLANVNGPRDQIVFHI